MSLTTGRQRNERVAGSIRQTDLPDVRVGFGRILHDGRDHLGDVQVVVPHRYLLAHPATQGSNARRNQRAEFGRLDLQSDEGVLARCESLGEVLEHG